MCVSSVLCRVREGHHLSPTDLATGMFLDAKRNAIFISGTGTANTHLCIVRGLSSHSHPPPCGRFFNLVDPWSINWNRRKAAGPQWPPVREAAAQRSQRHRRTRLSLRTESQAAYRCYSTSRSGSKRYESAGAPDGKQFS